MDTQTLDTTPVTTPETTTAAPAIAETVSTPTTSQRPTSAGELASWMESHASEAATPAPTAAPTETAATEPAAPTTQDGVTPPSTDKGPIPFDVHHKALDNARTKAIAEYRERFGWAEQIKPEVVQAWSSTAQQMATDPIAFLERFQSELVAHPVYGPQLRSHAARTLAGGRQTQAPSFDPEVQIVDAQGNVTGATFSAAQVKAMFERELAPLKTEHEQRQAETHAAETRRVVETQADTQIADVVAIVGQHEPELQAVARAMQDHPDWSPQRAASHVFATLVKPSIEGKAKQSVLTDFNKKAAGNTATSAGAGATPTKPRSVKDLAAYMANLDAAGGR